MGDVDGIRLDTAMYVPEWFVEQFELAAERPVFGEVATRNVSYHRSFNNHMRGLLNFPAAASIKHAFKPHGDFAQLRSVLAEQSAAGYPDLNLLGNFVDNHDGPRFPYLHGGNASAVKNGLAFTMLYHGMPIVYYGTEQLNVSNQNHDNRKPMWPHYDHTDLTAFIAELSRLRKGHGFGPGGSVATELASVVAAQKDALAFVRGEILVLVRNTAEPTRLCVPADALKATSWSTACSNGDVAADSLLRPWKAHTWLSCSTTGDVCIDSGAGGHPAVFKLG